MSSGNVYPCVKTVSIHINILVSMMHFSTYICSWKNITLMVSFLLTVIFKTLCPWWTIQYCMFHLMLRDSPMFFVKHKNCALARCIKAENFVCRDVDRFLKKYHFFERNIKFTDSYCSEIRLIFVNFMLFIQCIYLKLIHQPTNANNKIQLMTNIKSPTCFGIGVTPGSLFNQRNIIQHADLDIHHPHNHY